MTISYGTPGRRHAAMMDYMTISDAHGRVIRCSRFFKYGACVSSPYEPGSVGSGADIDIHSPPR
jgi:hypothetical protein